MYDCLVIRRAYSDLSLRNILQANWIVKSKPQNKSNVVFIMKKSLLHFEARNL